MSYYQITATINFTIKGQELEEIENAIFNWGITNTMQEFADEVWTDDYEIIEKED